MKTADKTNDYLLFRVKNRVTGKPTTISLDPVLFIRLCQFTRDLKAAGKLVRKLAGEIPLDPSKPFAAQVSEAIASHIKAGKPVTA